MTRFGPLIRQARVDAGLSLRALAKAIGTSHVYLGEVEREIKAPLKRAYWPVLMAAIPTLTEAQLLSAEAASKPISASMPSGKVREAMLQLARDPDVLGLDDALGEQLLEAIRKRREEGGE